MDKHEVQKRLDALLKQMDEMLAAGLNDETRAEYDTIEKEAENLRADLTRIEKQEQRSKWAAQPSPNDKPVIEMGDAPADKPCFRSLADNIEAVINASVPGARYDERLRPANADPSKAAALGGEKRASGMSEGAAAYGGFLLQTDHANDLLAPMWDTGVLTPRVQSYTLTQNANSVKFTVLDETDRGRGYRLGGLRLYTREEASQVTASKPKFRDWEVNLKSVMGICYFTEEQMQDTPAIVSQVQNYFQNEAGYEIDEFILNGDGASEPLGITKHAALISASKETGQAADTVVAENVINMYARMPGRNRVNGIWTHPANMLPQLMVLEFPGVNAAPLWLAGNSLASAPNDRLINKPLVELEQSPTLGDANDLMFIDPTQYLLVKKGGAKVDLSMHVQFLYGETVLRFMFRVGGGSWWSSAITPANDGDTLGPFIGLAERA